VAQPWTSAASRSPQFCEAMISQPEPRGLPTNAKASVAESMIIKNPLATATISARYGRRSLAMAVETLSSMMTATPTFVRPATGVGATTNSAKRRRRGPLPALP
jgi:hypothetical protein